MHPNNICCSVSANCQSLCSPFDLSPLQLFRNFPPYFTPSFFSCQPLQTIRHPVWGPGQPIVFGFTWPCLFKYLHFCQMNPWYVIQHELLLIKLTDFKIHEIWSVMSLDSSLGSLASCQSDDLAKHQTESCMLDRIGPARRPMSQDWPLLTRSSGALTSTSACLALHNLRRAPAQNASSSLVTFVANRYSYVFPATCLSFTFSIYNFM